MTDINNEVNEPRIIKTQDENGEIHNFELIDIINIDDQDYGLLVYLDAEGNESEKSEEDDEDEVVIMRLSKQDDAFTFETIEDDEEFDKVVTYLETMEDEEEDEE